jgi:hypothetical protein
MASLSSIPRPTREQLALPLLVAALLILGPLTDRAACCRRCSSAAWAGSRCSSRGCAEHAGETGQLGRTLALPSVATAAVLIGTAIVFARRCVGCTSSTPGIWRNGHGLFVPLFMILLARSACGATR